MFVYHFPLFKANLSLLFCFLYSTPILYCIVLYCITVVYSLKKKKKKAVVVVAAAAVVVVVIIIPLFKANLSLLFFFTPHPFCIVLYCIV